jgi:hypothetical protein
MRLAIFVPVRYGQHWNPDPQFTTWEAFQRKLTELAGAVSVSNMALHRFAKGHYGWDAHYLVEAFPTDMRACGATLLELRNYARQLVGWGEEAILILDGQKPVWVR